jgi:hypothetical protein
LSADLSGATAETRELQICSDCGGGAGGGVSALFAMPAGELAGSGCVARNVGDGVASIEAD